MLGTWGWGLGVGGFGDWGLGVEDWGLGDGTWDMGSRRVWKCDSCCRCGLGTRRHATWGAPVVRVLCFVEELGGRTGASGAF